MKPYYNDTVFHTIALFKGQGEGSGGDKMLYKAKMDIP